MSKKSEQIQKAAYDAHQRGKKAFGKGDIYGALVNDDESRDLAIQAMLLRMKGK